MLKSVLFRLWLMGSAALIAMLMPVAAVAEPIIIIIGSQHNLQYAIILDESLRTKLGIESRLIPAVRASMFSG